MPSLTTHYFFSKDVFNKLNKETQNKIKDKIDTYHLFAQSHDLLFFYTLDLKNYKRIRNLGHYAHRNNTQKYILNIIKEIKNNKLENNPEIIAYLYGIITHYVLDTTCHPYIFYKTGVYRKKEKNTYKYRGEHNKIEKHLDAIYYEKNTNKKYNNCNLNSEIIKKTHFSENIVKTINNVYKATYNEENIGIYIEKSVKQMRLFNKFIVNDKLGIKSQLYKLIDFITNHRMGYLSVYTTHITKPNINYLNIEKKEWNHPSNPNIKYNYSFEELYQISLEKTLIIIKEINKVLYENTSIKELIKYIPNLDYATGLLIEESTRMDYFEY